MSKWPRDRKTDFVQLFERLYERRPVGVAETALADAERRLGVAIPAPLRAFYLACGAEPCVMAAHNRFYGPAGLRYSEGRILFCEENQGACVWGCRPEEGADAEVGNVLGEDTLEWHSEEVWLSQFLEILLYLQTAWGGFEHAGDLQDPEPVMPRIEASWERVVDHQDLTIYRRGDALISALDGQPFLTAAARTSEGFVRHLGELGFNEM